AERLIHVLLAANAALALLEYAIGYRFFPFRFEGVELEWDMRSTGLSGHPLENAQLTSIYIMALLAGGGLSMPSVLRAPAVFLQLSAHEILLGANPDMIDSIRRTLGLELGIENPIVRFALYQGVIFTGFLTIGLSLFLVEIMRRLRPGYGMALLSFVVIVNSYESISNKTVALAQFVVLMIAMFHKPAPVWLAFGAGNRTQDQHATQPLQVSA